MKPLAPFRSPIKFACLFVAMLFANSTFADPEIWSAVITYKSAINGVFTVDVKVTVGCSGDTAAYNHLKISSTCSTFTATGSRYSTKDITGVGAACQTQSNCQGGTLNYGLSEITYRYQVDLRGINCCDWTFSYGQKRRTAKLTTGHANTPILVYAMTNTCNGIINNSVQYQENQPWRTLHNKDAVIPSNATDQDHDSLAFLPIDPVYDSLYQSGTPIYTAYRPLTFLGWPNQNLAYPGGYRVNQHSGTLLFRPVTLNQVASIAMKVQEWRKINGTMTLVGETSREFTLQVDTLSKSNVGIQQGNVSTSSQLKEVCAGNQLCFTINPVNADSNFSDSLTLTWHASMPGATFNITKIGANDKGEFCWTPSLADTSSQPYFASFTATGRDCPMPGKATTEVLIYVRKPLPSVTHSITPLSCGRVIVDRDINFPVNVVQQWLFTDSATGKTVYSGKRADTLILDPGKYYSKLTVYNPQSSACQNVYLDSLTIGNFLQVSFGYEDTTLCAGDSINLNATASGAGAGLTYNWTIDNIPLTYNGSNLNMPHFASAVYKVVVNDQTACKDSASVNLTVRALPVANLGPDLNLCGLTSVTLRTDTANEAFWNNGINADSFEATSSGQYNVIVVDPYGCKNHDTISIGLNPIPVINLGNDIAECEGVDIQLDAGPGFDSYLWNTGTTSQTQDAMNSDTYWVTVTDTNGCVNSDTIYVNIKLLPAINLGPDKEICQGDSIVFSGGSGHVTYLWNTGNSGLSITARQQGFYSVQVTGQNQCAGFDTVYLTLNALPTNNLPSNTGFCTNDSLTLDAGAGYAAYLWSSGETSRIIVTDSVGQYSVEITNDKMCKATYHTNVMEFALPLVNLGPDTAICEYDKLRISPGYNFTKYEWNTLEGSPFIDVAAAGNYSVLVTDANGCKNSDSINLTILPTPDAGFTYTDNGNGNFSFTPDVPNLAYFWIFGDGDTSTASNPTHQYTKPGPFLVGLIVANQQGCFDTFALNITLTSVFKHINTLKANLYPNPASQYTILETELESNSTLTLSVYDLNGKLVMLHEFKDPSVGLFTTEIDLSTLSAGFYTVLIKNDHESTVLKLVKGQ